MNGLEGSYLSRTGSVMRDRVNLLYVGTPFTVRDNFDTLASYTDQLRVPAMDALKEEAILIVVYSVFHCE